MLLSADQVGVDSEACCEMRSSFEVPERCLMEQAAFWHIKWQNALPDDIYRRARLRHEFPYSDIRELFLILISHNFEGGFDSRVQSPGHTIGFRWEMHI